MMCEWYAAFIVCGPVTLLAIGLTPVTWANRHNVTLRALVTCLLVVALMLSLASAFLLMEIGALDCLLLPPAGNVNIGIYFDSIAAILLPLISFIGLIIARFSSRYLEGEAHQGRFIKWMSLTIGAVMFMIISRNLIMFTTAWILTSYALHHLLLHYPDRPWAVWAARKKFLISRLGDCFLIAALALTYSEYHSFDFSTIFATVHQKHSHSGDMYGAPWLIGILFVLGAMTKSAQFPFHSWLPDTMETPTPVSALMHAGVINAGGILVIRLSPLLIHYPSALGFLALGGAVTALCASIIAMTQTSIKRTLAWSTIAQMGFMMLQCGLGAFSLALMHIVAHSLYKAHAFLKSGSTIDAAATTPAIAMTASTRHPALATFLPSLVISLLIFLCIAWCMAVDLAAKPGYLVLGLIMVISLTQLIWPSITSKCTVLMLHATVSAAFVCVCYFLASQFIDNAVASSMPSMRPELTLWNWIILGITSAGFLGVLLLQAFSEKLAAYSAVRTLYVHASNGFYLDIPARRIVARFWGQTTPAP